MKKEVKVTVDKDVLEKAKAYAEAEGRSISDIVERYLKALCEYEPPRMEDLDPELVAMAGMGGELDETKSDKELIMEAWVASATEKHLK